MTKRRISRRVRVIAVTVALLGAGGVTVAAIRSNRTSDSSAPAAAAYATVAVTTGSLTTTESIDGTVESSASTRVLHRIEGEAASSSSDAGSSTSSGSSGAAASAGSVSGSGRAAGLTNAETIDPCAAPSVPSEPTATLPPETTSTVPVDTTPTIPGETTPSSPSEITTPAESATTIAAAPVTTVVCETTTTAGGALPVGGIAPSGGGGAIGSTSGTGQAGSTTRSTQVVTSVAAVGAEIGFGDVIYTVEGQPVVALAGRLPAWRTLSTSSTDGADIEQLEQSLVTLGYDPDSTMTVNTDFDAATKAVVKSWQTGVGVTPTGSVSLGSVVFLQTPATVSAQEAVVGASIGEGDGVVTLSASSQQVVINVPAEDQQFVVPGLAVELDGKAGTVTRLRSADGDDGVVVQAVVVPNESLGVADGAPVKVRVTIEDAIGVLVVPTEAVASKLDGRYAVEVEGADGTATWQTVDIVGVSGNKVGIRGDGIIEGTSVRVPA